MNASKITITCLYRKRKWKAGCLPMLFVAATKSRIKFYVSCCSCTSPNFTYTHCRTVAQLSLWLIGILLVYCGRVFGRVYSSVQTVRQSISYMRADVVFIKFSVDSIIFPALLWLAAFVKWIFAFSFEFLAIFSEVYYIRICRKVF